MNYIPQDIDCSNYDERLEIIDTITNPDHHNHDTFGGREDEEWVSVPSIPINYTIFHGLFTRSIFDLNTQGWVTKTHHADMISNLQKCIPLNVLDRIDGAQRRPQKYDDQGHPTRD